MGQRLGIAVALLGRPHTVMLDEPVNGLDPEGAARVAKISARSRRMSNAYSAPGMTESSASCTATAPSPAAGTGPRTVLTVLPG
jgi:ABC-type Na+ transport system ATPase subunit NatA